MVVWSNQPTFVVPANKRAKRANKGDKMMTANDYWITAWLWVIWLRWPKDPTIHSMIVELHVGTNFGSFDHVFTMVKL